MKYSGPVVLAILDGVGLAPDGPGNAVSKARTPWLGHAARDYLHLSLNASGEAVGLTTGQMGNSEVGHNTMGIGRAVKQGIARIEEAFYTGEVWQSAAWREAIARITENATSLHNSALEQAELVPAPEHEELGSKAARSVSGAELICLPELCNKVDNAMGIDFPNNVWYNEEIDPVHTLHFAGIFSDGGVHSHISHLEAMVKKAYEQGVRRMRVHAIFDGRDVGPQSEPKYIERFESFAQQFPDADIRIASGGGRMTTVADRYENDWNVVKRGFDMMVHGEAEYYFKTPEEGIAILRRINPEVQDQDLPAFVVVDENDQPVGKVEPGDSLIYFDFRADRAIEIAQAFTYYDFPYFDRGNYSPDDVFFVGMTEYNSDTHVPEHRLVEPIDLNESLHQFLGAEGISQLAVTETVKFGHLTYYFNGNSYEKAPGEEFIEIASYTEPFETRPWMKTAEITDAVVNEMGKYRFVRINFPGGDMVGHTANMEATIVAMEAIDLSLARIAAEVDKLGGVLVVVADHGNAEELFDASGNPKTAHTTNRVPCIIYDNTDNRDKYTLSGVANPGLANLAATMAVLLGFDQYPASWEPALIEAIRT